MSLIGDGRVINFQRTSDSVLCLGKIFENTQSNDAWEQRLGLLKTSPNYRNFDRIDGEPLDFEWTIFPGAPVVRSILLRFFSHGVLFVKFSCAPVFVCLKGP